MDTIPAPHHRLPSERDNADAERQADEWIAINRKIAEIITAAHAAITNLDLSGPSMVPGFDLSDLPGALKELMPLHDNAGAIARVDEAAREAVL